MMINLHQTQFFQIFSSFSAFTIGFALAIFSFPTRLKSKVHSCCSAYLWVPQNTNPHLHLKPVIPTRRRQVKQRLGSCGGFCSSSSSGSLAARFPGFSVLTSFRSEVRSAGGGGGGGEDTEEDATQAARVCLRAFLAVEEFSCSCFRSLKHLEQRFCVAVFPKKPQSLAHNRGS